MGNNAGGEVEKPLLWKTTYVFHIVLLSHPSTKTASPSWHPRAGKAHWSKQVACIAGFVGLSWKKISHSIFTCCLGPLLLSAEKMRTQLLSEDYCIWLLKEQFSNMKRQQGLYTDYSLTKSLLGIISTSITSIQAWWHGGVCKDATSKVAVKNGYTEFFRNQNRDRYAKLLDVAHGHKSYT